MKSENISSFHQNYAKNAKKSTKKEFLQAILEARRNLHEQSRLYAFRRRLQPLVVHRTGQNLKPAEACRLFSLLHLLKTHNLVDGDNAFASGMTLLLRLVAAKANGLAMGFLGDQEADALNRVRKKAAEVLNRWNVQAKINVERQLHH